MSGQYQKTINMNPLRLYIRRIISEALLKEDPDNVYLPKEHIRLGSLKDGAVPFGYYKGGLYIGYVEKWHNSVLRRYDVIKSDNSYDYDVVLDKAGRMWPDIKIISFWQIPTVLELKEFIKDWNSEKEYNYNITIDGSWYMEIPNRGTRFGQLVKLKDYKGCKYKTWLEFQKETMKMVDNGWERKKEMYEDIDQSKTNKHVEIDSQHFPLLMKLQGEIKGKYPHVNHGGCYEFARALHAITGLPYMLIFDSGLSEQDPQFMS